MLGHYQTTLRLYWDNKMCAWYSGNIFYNPSEAVEKAINTRSNPTAATFCRIAGIVSTPVCSFRARRNKAMRVEIRHLAGLLCVCWWAGGLSPPLELSEAKLKQTTEASICATDPVTSIKRLTMPSWLFHCSGKQLASDLHSRRTQVPFFCLRHRAGEHDTLSMGALIPRVNIWDLCQAGGLSINHRSL